MVITMTSDNKELHDRIKTMKKAIAVVLIPDNKKPEPADSIIEDAPAAIAFPTNEEPAPAIPALDVDRIYTNGIAMVSNWQRLMMNVRSENLNGGLLSTLPEWSLVVQRLQYKIADETTRFDKYSDEWIKGDDKDAKTHLLDSIGNIGMYVYAQAKVQPENNFDNELKERVVEYAEIYSIYANQDGNPAAYAKFHIQTKEILNLIIDGKGVMSDYEKALGMLFVINEIVSTGD